MFKMILHWWLSKLNKKQSENHLYFDLQIRLSKIWNRPCKARNKREINWNKIIKCYCVLQMKQMIRLEKTNRFNRD